MDSFSIYKLLGPAHYHLEETHSDIIAYLMRPSSELGASLLHHLVNRVMQDVRHDDLDYDHAQVQREVMVADGRGRIDILITIPYHGQAPLYLIIENKLGSGEHGNQLTLYYDVFAPQHAGFIFLSLTGQTPSHPQYHPISYAHFAGFLSDALQQNQLIIKPEVRVMINQYVQFLKHLAFSDFSPINTLRQSITSYLKDLIRQSDDIQLDAVETYQDTWVGMIPDEWRRNKSLMNAKEMRAAWGLAFHVVAHIGIEIAFYWHSNDAMITPLQLSDCLKSLQLSQSLHLPRRIGSGVKIWEAVYIRNILGSDTLQEILAGDTLDDVTKNHIVQKFKAFRQDVRVMAKALMVCSILSI